MSEHSSDIVSVALRRPAELASYTLAQWEPLIAQARSANLLGRIATLLEDAGTLGKIPEPPRAHLRAALRVARARQDAMRREIAHLKRALENTPGDVVLLKGAAYLLAGLPASRGRMFTDVDILVPEERLAQVEAALMLHGWATTHLDAYDQRYYRQWMHELPPMRHATRGTVVDVHHAILPRTSRLHPQSEKLLAAAQPIPGEPRLRVLAPVDMVLHSATHLFFNEELSQALRDLADLDALLCHFGDGPSFWHQLTDRARELDLLRPLYYAMRYAIWFLDSPVPAEAVIEASRGAPPRALRALMDSLFRRGLRPHHPDAADALVPAARLLLYVRAHWLRMPPLLLIRHLTIKALRREPAAATP